MLSITESLSLPRTEHGRSDHDLARARLFHCLNGSMHPDKYTFHICVHHDVIVFFGHRIGCTAATAACVGNLLAVNEVSETQRILTKEFMGVEPKNDTDSAHKRSQSADTSPTPYPHTSGPHSEATAFRLVSLRPTMKTFAPAAAKCLASAAPTPLEPPVIIVRSCLLAMADEIRPTRSVLDSESVL